MVGDITAPRPSSIGGGDRKDKKGDRKAIASCRQGDERGDKKEKKEKKDKKEKHRDREDRN